MGPGEVWEIKYPRTDGHEQHGERPGVVLQDEGYARRSPLVVTIPFTSSPRTMKYPAVLPVAATPDNGLTRDSFLLVFQIQATDRGRIGRKLGIVSPTMSAQIYDALDQLTGRVRPTTGGTP